MTTVIKLVSSDAQLAQILRETGMQCVAVPRDALNALAQTPLMSPSKLQSASRIRSSIICPMGAAELTSKTPGIG